MVTFSAKTKKTIKMNRSRNHQNQWNNSLLKRVEKKMVKLLMQRQKVLKMLTKKSQSKFSLKSSGIRLSETTWFSNSSKQSNCYKFGERSMSDFCNKPLNSSQQSTKHLKMTLSKLCKSWNSRQTIWSRSSSKSSQSQSNHSLMSCRLKVKSSIHLKLSLTSLREKMNPRSNSQKKITHLRRHRRKSHSLKDWRLLVLMSKKNLPMLEMKWKNT